MSTPEEGKTYICKRSLEGFTEGSLYKSWATGCLTDDSKNPFRSVPEEEFDKWFTPVTATPEKKEEAAKEFDPVNRPSHYVGNGIECIDAMQSAFGLEIVQDFCICNAFKYLFRCKGKYNFEQDLKKAKWYIDRTLMLECKMNNTLQGKE